MGLKQADRHIHHPLYHIPLLPGTFYLRIRICFCGNRNRLSIYGERGFPAPLRYAEEKGERSGLAGHPVELYTYIALPGINGLLRQGYFSLILPGGGQRIRAIQVAINAFGTQCISIVLRLAECAQRIGRATEATDILRPFLRPAKRIRQAGTDAERIRIEILLSVQTDTTQNAVIKTCLHYLRIPGISRHLQHAPVEKHIADVGAGFIMGCTIG